MYKINIKIKFFFFFFNTVTVSPNYSAAPSDLVYVFLLFYIHMFLCFDVSHCFIAAARTA